MNRNDQNQRVQSQIVCGNVNSNAIGLHYALLTRLAALDIELAKAAVQTGVAVDLTFPKDTVGFASAVSPSVEKSSK